MPAILNIIARGLDPKVCPNELYVALTRTKERMTMFHHVGNDALHFLDMNHKYVEYECRAFGSNSNVGRGGHAIEKPQELAVTQLISHMSESVIARAMEYFTVTRIRNKAGVIKIKTKTEQGSLTESVAELNGLLIPAVYEYRTMGNMEMYKLMRDMTPLELQQGIKGGVGSANGGADSKLNLDSIPDLLELANVWNATKTGFIFKVKQIKKYDWLCAAELEACIARLATLDLSADKEHVQYESYLYNQGSRELYNRRLHGYADYMDDHRLFEFKCVHELEPVHFIQLALYMYLAKIENQRHLISTHGRESVRHIKAGDVVMVNLFPEPEFGTVCTGLQAQCNATGVTPILRPPGVGLEFNVSGTGEHDQGAEHTAESQLLVHSLLSVPEREVRVMDSRSSIGVYDKSAPHGTEYLYSDIITGMVIMAEGGQYIISESDDKVHDLRAEHMIMNLSWVKANGLLKQYTYYLYNILTDELFTVGAELGKLRQMVDYLIYQKYFNEQRKTDQEFLCEVLAIKQDAGIN